MRAGHSAATALFTTTFFVFFLTASAPHRVHHLFEKISHSNPQDGRGQRIGIFTGGTENKTHGRSGPGQTNCPIQQTAQSCQISPIELVALYFLNQEINESSIKVPISFGRVTPFRLSPRAPPQHSPIRLCY